MRSLAFVLLTAVVALSADGVSGPVSGIVYMPSAGNLRVLRGLPGGALLGPAVALPDGLQITTVHASVGAGAGSLGDAVVLITGLDSGAVRTIAVPSLSAAPELMAGSGDYVAMYSRTDRRLVLVANWKSESPAFRTLVDDVVVVSVAVTKSGAVIAALADGDATELITASSSLPVQRITRLGPAVSIAATISGEALISDASRDEVFSLSTTGELRLLASARDGVSGPVAVHSHGTATFVANARNSTLLIMDGGIVSTLELPCAPDGLEPVRHNGVLRLNRSATGPQYFLEPASRSVFFVPAEVPANE